MAPDTESVSWLRIVLAFTIVFGLIAAMGFVLKRISMNGIRMPGMAPRSADRLKIIESMPLDARRRLVIVACDGDEHLLLLGTEQDIVVKSNLKKNQPSLSDAKIQA